jgi:uncharacterized protein YdhG (YjbR/CyaY superfamily)
MANKTRAAKGAKKASTFTDEEKAAMREVARERKARPEDGEKDILAKIKAMAPEDRALAEKIHGVVRAAAPALTPKTWYGMPAYARDGKIVCFFQDARKFKARYATFGFNDQANLDDGDLWPTSFAITRWTNAVEQKITDLVKKAVR